MSREVAIEELNDLKVYCANSFLREETIEDYVNALNKGIEALKNQKIGYWINVDYGYYECSECGRIEMGNPNYCQDCGAKMVE